MRNFVNDFCFEQYYMAAVKENVFPDGEGAFFIVPSTQYHKIVPFATLQ